MKSQDRLKMRGWAGALQYLLTTVVVGGLVGIWCSTSSRAATSLSSDDWPDVNHDTCGTRYSPLNTIDTHNASRLKKACTYTFPDKEPSQTAPIDGIF